MIARALAPVVGRLGGLAGNIIVDSLLFLALKSGLSDDLSSNVAHGPQFDRKQQDFAIQMCGHCSKVRQGGNLRKL